MKTKSKIFLACLLGFVCLSDSNATAQETRYLAFQIFTYGPNPLNASMGEGKLPQPARFPDKAVLRDYIQDIKQRIGAVGERQTRLAVMLGPLAFDHSDAETTQFIGLGFELALETDEAIGFHIDDSMFWGTRKEPSAAPPQRCFNSKVIQQEVQQRAALLGKAIQAGVTRLRERNRPELFAGVIAGWETMIGQDFKTGKYLGYRALLNRGFSREHPPQDMDLEREKVVQQFIELWTTGIADAGVSPQKIYSHTAFLSRRSFGLGGSKQITHMQRSQETAYSQHNHFAPPTVAFGSHHRPGFSTYPQPGLYDDIYEQLEKHKQVEWASCEGTNMQPSSGPGQTGMGMETYLAKMFNHGGALVNIFAWGIGGPAIKDTNPFRIVTEGEEALRAYRKFLKGEPLIEGEMVASLMERLPPKIHKIQADVGNWIQETGKKDKPAALKAMALMQKLQTQIKAKDFEEAETTADELLKMVRAGTPAIAGADAPSATKEVSEEALKKLRHDVGGSFIVSRDEVQEDLKLTAEQKEKLQALLGELVPDALRFFRKIQGLNPEDRKKELTAYRPKAQEKLAAKLTEILDGEQRTRLRQLELQREGLRNGEIWKDLQITNEQRTKFMAMMRQAQQETQLLLEKLNKGGTVQEIQPQVIKVRDDLEGKLEVLLTDTQKKQWHEMLGKPIDLNSLFDL
jgi:hypothetical protein